MDKIPVMQIFSMLFPQAWKYSSLRFLLHQLYKRGEIIKFVLPKALKYDNSIMLFQKRLFSCFLLSK